MIMTILSTHIYTVRVVYIAALALDAPELISKNGEKIDPASLAEVVYPDFIGVFVKLAKRFSTAFQNISGMIVNPNDAP